MKTIVKIFKKVFIILLPILFIAAYAAEDVKALPDGTTIDLMYYKNQNPDVVALLGEDPDVLADHYWNHGIQEGRRPYAGAKDVGASSVITLVNNYRASQGRGTLTIDPLLMAAAQERAKELAQAEHFAHTRPDGRRWQTVLGDNLTSYTKVGENLGRKQTSAENLVYAWQQSAGHNQVLLHPEFNKVGVGVAKSSSGHFYFVLIAGSKK